MFDHSSALVCIEPVELIALQRTTEQNLLGPSQLIRSIMSSSASEKDLRSLDEDSGHDSIDDAYSSPAEDRERIEHLETVVTWIRREVVSQSCVYSVLILCCVQVRPPR